VGIVTKVSTPWPVEYLEDCDPPDYSEPDDNLVAVRRLTDGDLGVHSELYQEARLIPIALLPKLSVDAIPDWPTPTGQRRMTFGVPFADSTEFEKYGEGNMYLTAKSAPGASVRDNKGLPQDDFARMVRSYQVGMLFCLDDASHQAGF
jgi:hypothetical protein